MRAAMRPPFHYSRRPLTRMVGVALRGSVGDASRICIASPSASSARYACASSTARARIPHWSSRVRSLRMPSTRSPRFAAAIRPRPSSSAAISPQLHDHITEPRRRQRGTDCPTPWGRADPGPVAPHALPRCGQPPGSWPYGRGSGFRLPPRCSHRTVW